MRIALAGNPNSGKTTMYNALTGRSEKVGNWAGVTVDKKEHPIKKAYAADAQLIAVDLPGAYSMSPFTSEESITSSYVKKENPDVIINIVDATNLSRSLFFTTQLLELGIPVVVALNKSDINEKKDTKIDDKALSAKLGCPVVSTVSTSAAGLRAVVEAAVALVGKTQSAPYSQGDIDLCDKATVEAADRMRHAGVAEAENDDLVAHKADSPLTVGQRIHDFFGFGVIGHADQDLIGRAIKLRTALDPVGLKLGHRAGQTLDLIQNGSCLADNDSRGLSILIADDLEHRLAVGNDIYRCGCGLGGSHGGFYRGIGNGGFPHIAALAAGAERGEQHDYRQRQQKNFLFHMCTPLLIFG